ncbi:MAG: BTAD domain-containing putative transcriptional regulator [Geminicoccaceae bacterium]
MTRAGGSPPIRLSLFGGLSLQTPDGRALALSSRKALALLAYLGLAPGMAASRDKLADLLWSDRGTEQARNSLRQTLTVLRRELGPDLAELVQSRRDVLALDESLIGIDAQDFLVSLAERATESLQAAVDLYRGPFLDGFFAGSEEFEGWAATERERFLSLAGDAMDELARRLGPDSGLPVAKRLLKIDPAREATYRLLMELSAAAGHRDKALQHFEGCRDMMRRVFGVEPSAETLALRARIAADERVTAAPDPSPPIAPTGSDTVAESLPTVRVLNFVNLTVGTEADAFARGLAHEVIHALLRHRGVRVLSEGPPGSASAPTGEARYVISGSVQTTASHIRINVQLIDLAQGTHVWAERYDGGIGHMLALQDEVAHSIAIATHYELMTVRRCFHDRAPVDEPEVRLLVRSGMLRYFELTHESVATAIAMCEQALRLDPNSVRAMRALAFSLSGGIAQGLLRAPEDKERAVRIAERAVALVPDDDHARWVLAWTLGNAGRNAEAVAQLKHALTLNPGYAGLYSELAEQYATMGLSAESIAAAHESIRLGSMGVVEFWRYHALACAHFAAGDYAEALANARKVIWMKPVLLRGALILAASAAAVGEMDEAAAAVARARDLVPDLRLGDVAPGIMPRYVQDEHHARFQAMLRRAGLPD